MGKNHKGRQYGGPAMDPMYPSVAGVLERPIFIDTI